MRASPRVLAVDVLVVMAACVEQPPPEPPKISQLQARQLQTREFRNETLRSGMKAVAAALQDEGFSIDLVNVDLGLLKATRQLTDEDTEKKNFQILWYGEPKEYRAIRQWDATVTIQDLEQSLKVRVSVVEKTINNKGGVTSSQPVVDPTFYQAIFSKVDKSVFLQKNKL